MQRLERQLILGAAVQLRLHALLELERLGRLRLNLEQHVEVLERVLGPAHCRRTAQRQVGTAREHRGFHLSRTGQVEASPFAGDDHHSSISP